MTDEQINLAIVDTPTQTDDIPPEKMYNVQISTFEHLKIWIYRLRKTTLFFGLLIIILLGVLIPTTVTKIAMKKIPQRWSEKLFSEDLLAKKGIDVDERFTFELKHGADFKAEEYYGKEKLLEGFVSELILKTHICNSFTQEDCKMYFKAEDMHNFFLGPSGTGKTQFIKKAVFILDVRLKQIMLGVEKGENPTKITFRDYKDMSSSEKNRIDSMASRVKYYSVTPSDLTGRYVGNSEALLKSLFDLIIKDQPKYSATVVLFDEAEALFPVRSGGDSGNSLTNSRLAEFLSQYNRLNEQIRPIFLVAITNVWHAIDPAIKRRFFNHTHFEMPDRPQLQLMLESKIDKSFITDAQKTKILDDCATGISQANFMAMLTDAIERDNDGIAYGFDMTAFEIGLKNYRDAMGFDNSMDNRLYFGPDDNSQPMSDNGSFAL